MKIDKKLIKELKDYLDEFNLSEIEYQDGTKKVKVAKNISGFTNITSHKPNIPPKKRRGRYKNNFSNYWNCIFSSRTWCKKIY